MSNKVSAIMKVLELPKVFYTKNKPIRIRYFPSWHQ